MYDCDPVRDGQGRLSAWHLPCGPVGPPARWAAITSNVEGGSVTDEGAQVPLATEEWLYMDKLSTGVPDFIVTPLLMGPVCLF